MTRLVSLTNKKGRLLLKTNMLGEKELNDMLNSEEQVNVEYKDNNINSYSSAILNPKTRKYFIRGGAHEITVDTLVKMIFDKLSLKEWDDLKIETDFPKVIGYYCKIHSREEEAEFGGLISFPGFGQIAQYTTPSHFSFNYREMMEIAKGNKDDSWWKKYATSSRA